MYRDSCIRAGLSDLSPQGLRTSWVFCPSRQKLREAGNQVKEFSAWKVRKPGWLVAPLMTGFRVRDLLDCVLGSESESAQG